MRTRCFVAVFGPKPVACQNAMHVLAQSCSLVKRRNVTIKTPLFPFVALSLQTNCTQYLVCPSIAPEPFRGYHMTNVIIFREAPGQLMFNSKKQTALA